MTTTPRELSDAIQADHDEILDTKHANEVRAIDRWALVANIAKWGIVGAGLAVFAVGLLGTLTGSLIGWIVFMLVFAAWPFLVVPLTVVWVASATTAATLRRKLAAKMFTLYGITVNRDITPPVYSVAGMSPSLMNPALHRSWKLLTGANLTVGDTEPVADEK